MKYFNVTVMDKGKKRQELIQADSKMIAIKLIKSKFPTTMVMKAEETSAPLEDTLAAFMSGFTKSMKSKIPVNDKISTIDKLLL